MLEIILLHVGEKKFAVTFDIYEVNSKHVKDAIKQAQDTEELSELLIEINPYHIELIEINDEMYL